MNTKAVKFLLSALIICAPMFGMAQDRGNRGDMATRMKEQSDALKKELKLDKKQTKSFDEAQEKYNKKRQELISGTGDREGMREKMGEMRDGLNADLKKILTDKQYKKMEAIEKKRREERGQGRGQGRGGNGRGGR